jgi:hypothetical protein
MLRGMTKDRGRIFAAAALVFFAGTAGARGTAGSRRRVGLASFCGIGSRRGIGLASFCNFPVLSDRDHREHIRRMAMRDPVDEIFDISDACGSEFGVRLIADRHGVTHLPLGLDAAQFGEIALQGPLGSGAGAVDGGLHAIDVLLAGRVLRGRIRRGRFEGRATAQAPGCLHEFGNKSFLDGSVGREVSVPGGAEFPISVVFVGTDECGCREEAKSSRVAGRALFAVGRDRAGGELRVRAIRQKLDFRRHVFMSGSRLAWRVKLFVDVHRSNH